MTFVYVLSNVQETVKRNVKRHIFLYILFCETLTFSLYSTRTSVMRTTDTFLAQSSDSHRTSTSLVLTLYSSAVTNLSFLKVKKRIAMFKALQYLSIGCIVDVRVLSRIYRLGEKSWVSEGHKVSKGSGGMPPPPRNLFKWICAEMQCDAFCDRTFWEMLQCVHWPRRVWMIFPI